MTVKQYIHLEKIQSGTINDVDKLAYSICYLYNKSFDEVDKLTERQFLKLSTTIAKLVTIKPYPVQLIRFQTDAKAITFGQFIECQEWLKNSNELKIHMIAASILKSRTDHKKDAGRMLNKNVRAVIPSVTKFVQSFENLIIDYKFLFAIEKEEDDAEIKKKSHPFLSNFGWIFSAKEVANHLGIPLNKAFDIGVIEALNTLAYLKSKQKYDKWMTKQ